MLKARGIIMEQIFRVLTVSTPSIAIYVSLFSILSLLELVFAFLEKERARKIVKPFLLLTLAIYSIILVADHIFLIIGIFFGMLGDICFIFKDKKKFIYLGLFTFMANHIFYLIDMIVSFKDCFNSAIVITLSIVYSLFLFVCLFLVKKILNIEWAMTIIGSFYMVFLFLDFGFQILLTSQGYSYFVLGIIGGAFFIISDSLLSYTLFIKDIKRRDFYIMFTYILAQAFILSGLLITYLI